MTLGLNSYRKAFKLKYKQHTIKPSTKRWLTALLAIPGVSWRPRPTDCRRTGRRCRHMQVFFFFFPNNTHTHTLQAMPNSKPWKKKFPQAMPRRTQRPLHTPGPEQEVPSPEQMGPRCLVEVAEDAEVSWVIVEVEGQSWWRVHQTHPMCSFQLRRHKERKREGTLKHQQLTFWSLKASIPLIVIAWKRSAVVSTHPFRQMVSSRRLTALRICHALGGVCRSKTFLCLSAWICGIRDLGKDGPEAEIAGRIFLVNFSEYYILIHTYTENVCPKLYLAEWF